MAVLPVMDGQSGTMPFDTRSESCVIAVRRVLDAGLGEVFAVNCKLGSCLLANNSRPSNRRPTTAIIHSAARTKGLSHQYKYLRRYFGTFFFFALAKFLVQSVERTIGCAVTTNEPSPVGSRVQQMTLVDDRD